VRIVQTLSLFLCPLLALGALASRLTIWIYRIEPRPAKVVRIMAKSLLILAAVAGVLFIVAVAIAGGIRLEPR
jgi:hypothetical protein